MAVTAEASSSASGRTVLAARQQHHPLVRVLAAGGVAGEDVDGLQPEERPGSGSRRRHEADHPGVPRGPDDGAQRLIGLAPREAGQGVSHDLDALVHGQQGDDVGVGQDQDRHGGGGSVRAVAKPGQAW